MPTQADLSENASESELPSVVHAVRGIKMAAPCAKVNLALSGSRVSRYSSESHAAQANLLHARSFLEFCRAVL